MPHVCYRFGPFALSTATRTLRRGDVELPLIPRYFDLLVLLVARRPEAVPRSQILDAVWPDVVVSDGALSQAVRTLRRALGDEPREPVFIRTVSRHGYRFVFPDVTEETDGAAAPGVPSRHPAEPLWLEALRLAIGRASPAALGAALAGLAAGALGGFALRWAAGWNVPATVPAALGLVGAIAGGLGGWGVGAGLGAAEAAGRGGPRGLALVTLGALGGGAVGALAHLLGRWTIEGLFGRPLPRVGGGLEGLALGGAIGLGYWISAPRPRGAGLPPGLRLRAAAVAALFGAAAGVALVALGGQLAGTSLNAMARLFQGSQVGLAPLARLVGEPDLGPLTRALLGAYEGAWFGAGAVLGFTRRPR